MAAEAGLRFRLDSESRKLAYLADLSEWRADEDDLKMWWENVKSYLCASPNGCFLTFREFVKDNARASSFKLITCWLNENCLLMWFSINSKHEARNLKQIRMTKTQNSKRDEPRRYSITVWNVLVIWYSRLDIVSSFDIRISRSRKLLILTIYHLLWRFPENNALHLDFSVL